MLILYQEILINFHKEQKKTRLKNLFLKKYGHLRPSTYSISSLSYRENFENYFNQKNTITKKKPNKFKLRK